MLYANPLSNLSTTELDAMGFCPEDDLRCEDLKKMLVFCHDENCYMPEPFCDAVARAGMALRDIRPYHVSRTMVDYGFAERTIRSFATEDEAIDFMLSYDGSGDCLNLSYGQMQDQQSVGYVDLCERYPTFVRIDGMHVYHDCNEAYDEELPF